MIKAALKKLLSESTRARLRRAEQLAFLPFRVGSAVDCPCCGLSFRHFLHFYGEGNVRCPYCNSLPRQRFQAALLRDLRKFELRHDRILHVAAEFSLNLFLRRIAAKNRLRLDSLQSFIPGMCVRPDVVGDLRQLEFPSGSFKLIICNHVLEHIEEDRTAIKEIYRVLSDDGFALVTVPVRGAGLQTLEESWINSDELRTQHYGSPTHVRMYGADVTRRFAEAGFAVDVKRPSQMLPDVQIARQRLVPDEPHFFLTKRSDESAAAPHE